MGLPGLRVWGLVGSLEFELQRCLEDFGVFLRGVVSVYCNRRSLLPRALG